MKDPSGASLWREEEDALFALLEEARAHAHAPAGRAAWLRGRLRHESHDAIEAYVMAYERLLERANRWPLFAASLLAGETRDATSFRAFRAWVVSLGGDAYRAALADADSLADALSAEPPPAVAVGTLLRDAYAQQTGRALPEPALGLFAEPEGSPILDSDVPVRFPRVAAALRRLR